MVYPETLLEIYNSCLLGEKVLDDWKEQRLIPLKKEEKPLDKASSYRLICSAIRKADQQ